MLKRRCAFYLALISGTLTVMIGLMENVRLLTIGYRSVISIIIFAICGYIGGSIAERFIKEIESASKPKGQKLDIMANDTDTVLPPPPLEEESDNPNTEFSPFTVKNFDRIVVEPEDEKQS